MAIHLIWSPKARTDLMDIYVTIGRDEPAAAERYFDRIETLANLLLRQPRLGVRRGDIRKGMRILIERPYLHLYETHPDSDDEPIETIEIVRIVDGRRDLAGLF